MPRFSKEWSLSQLRFPEFRLHMTDPTPKRVLGLRELIAMGIGGMIGGGIFSLLGISVQISGNAAPFAFAIGSMVAIVAGYSYVRLALTYRADGASFTYLERAFPRHPNVAGIAGWTVVVGYIATMALYAFTFGAFGALLLGLPNSLPLRAGLSAGILLFFMFVNLIGARESGLAEDVAVYAKVAILAVFGVAGIFVVRADNYVPLFDQGGSSIIIAGALIFVAYEGFQLITNAVLETKDPDRNIPRAIYGSIVIVSVIYVTIAAVAVGSLTVDALIAERDQALAVAARPALGDLGVLLVGIAALLATSSAINATVFGASRMAAEIATERLAPKAFSFRNRRDVPWFAVLSLTVLALLLSVGGGLEMIAAFSSMTFLLVSIGVSIANLRLHKVTGSSGGLVVLGLLLMTVTTGILGLYLWENDRETLWLILGIYATVTMAELLLSRRRISWRRGGR